ncbi:TIGR03943 family putative permease subunit [Kineosporia babensis]|uniref:TIGR03943 family protein n=1 Tax=Kineosporia babensis TaxID=499548 RepID=A0A9X1NBL1_9ACTN|nr:TIGR03943 family protein [Kineosporia babensis]
MRRQLQWLVLVTLGCVVAHVGLTDLHLRYVQPFMRPALIVTGAVLVLLGLADLLMALRRGHHEQGHGAAPRTTWLLLLPVLCIGALTPPALGSYSAQRAVDVSAVDNRSDEEIEAGFEALAQDDVLELTLAEFNERAYWDESKSLEGRTVRLVGFVSRSGEQDWELARMMMQCCAADAAAILVTVTGQASPARDQWVEVEGVWQPDDASIDPGSQPPTLAATRVTAIPAPRNGYE